MASRRKARIYAFQALYGWSFTNEPVETLVEFSWIDEEKRNRIDDETLQFARHLLIGTIEQIEEIDELIRTQLDHWDFQRISRVDLALLRMSVYALMFQRSIPSTVTIDEAVDIAKEYGSLESYRFVNGVLDGVRKKHLGKT